VSRQSRLSANYKGDNQILTEAPGIYITTEENSGKSQQGCANSHCLKWGPLPPN
jgi:hypothetical protein